MPVTVRIPTPLQRLTNGQGEVQCQGQTVKELLSDLEQRHPGVKERICDESGALRRFVNVFVNEEDIRFLKAEETVVKDGDEISIVPAIAGGANIRKLGGWEVRRLGSFYFRTSALLHY